MGHNLATTPGGNRFLDIPVASVNALPHYTSARPSGWDGMLMINIMETNGPTTTRITNLPAGLTHANIAPNFAPIEFAISIPEGGPVLSFIGG
jgi:hypothetical protein